MGSACSSCSIVARSAVDNQYFVPYVHTDGYCEVQIWHPKLSFTRAILGTYRFFLWGWINSEVYSIKVDTRYKFLDIIMDVIANLKESQDFLRRANQHVVT